MNNDIFPWNTTTHVSLGWGILLPSLPLQDICTLDEIMTITDTHVPHHYILTYVTSPCRFPHSTQFYPIFGRPSDTRSCFMVFAIHHHPPTKGSY